MIRAIDRKKSLEKRRFWETHVRAWAKSGLTQAAYCRQYDLKVHRFIYWKKRVRRHGPPVTFVPVDTRKAIQPKSSSLSSIRMVVDNRFEISVDEGFSPETLEKLIRTLGRV